MSSAIVRGPVDGEAARRDQRLAVLVLDPLEEAEGEQILDVTAALPDRSHVAREHEPAGRDDALVVERLEELLHRVALEGRVGVDGHHELGCHLLEREALGAGLRARVLRRADHGRAGRLGNRCRVVGRAVVDHDHLAGWPGLLEERADRLRDRLRLVVRGNDRRQARVTHGSVH
jgi:hypothetical protein